MLTTRGFAVFTTLVRLSIPIVLATMAGAMSPAQADTITQTIGVPFGPYLSYDEPQAAPVYFASFDPSLGTLTDTTIQAQGTYIPSIGWEGGSGFTPTAELTSTLVMGPHYADLGTEVGTFSSGGLDGGGYTGQSQPFNVTFDFGNDQSFLPDPNYPNGPKTDFIVGTSPSDFCICGPASIIDVYDYTEAFGTLTVTYTYDPVPEPASLALMLAGLVCLWGVRRISKA